MFLLLPLYISFRLETSVMLLLCCVVSFSKPVLPVELEIRSDARNADQSLDTDAIQTVSLPPTSQTVSLPPTSQTTSIPPTSQTVSRQVRQSPDKPDSQPPSDKSDSQPPSDKSDSQPTSQIVSLPSTSQTVSLPPSNPQYCSTPRKSGKQILVCSH